MRQTVGGLHSGGNGFAATWLQSPASGPVHASAVQTLLSSQFGGVEWLQFPAFGPVHASFVQTLLSSQFGGVECSHWSVVGLQVSVVQTLLSLQLGQVSPICWAPCAVAV
jgi:hypothetical protein